MKMKPVLCCPICSNVLNEDDLLQKEYVCRCGCIYCSEHGIPVLIPINSKEEWVKKARKDKIILDNFYLNRIQQQNEWWRPYNEYRKILLDYSFQVMRKPVFDSITSDFPKLTHILDAGGGDGWLLNYLLQKYPEAKGYNIDLSSVVVANGLKRHNNPRMFGYSGDITHLPFVDETFDVILCIEVLEHTRDVEGFINCAYRKLRKGGKIYITTPNPESWVLYFEAAGLEKIKNLIRPIFGKKRNEIKTFGYTDNEKEGYEVFRSAGEITSILKKIGFTEIKVKFNWVIGSLPFYYFEKFKLLKIAKIFSKFVLPIDIFVSKMSIKFLGEDTFISAKK
jgi:SAM-dependent methyltransferase